MLLEQFVVIMYDRSSTICKVDEARLDLFARQQRTYSAIPPTKAALLEHVKRVLQAGNVFGASKCTRATGTISDKLGLVETR